MKKITYKDLVDTFMIYNENHGITQQFDDNALNGIIVFKSSNWPDKNYSLEERSYEVSSANKRYLVNMSGNSIFGNCLDGNDLGVRLDWYIDDNTWEIDYCYILEN